MSRFAKLFYPLGIEQEGIDRYISFVRSSLAETCGAVVAQLPRASEGEHSTRLSSHPAGPK